MSDNMTPTTWAAQELALLGDTPSTNDMTAMEAWEAGEGGAGPEWDPNGDNLASFNPLDSTQAWPEPNPDSTDTNPPGQPAIQAYNSWQEGLAATAGTLEQDQKGYAQIRADLASNADPAQTYADIDASAWGTHDLSTSDSPSAGSAGSSGSSGSGTGLSGPSGAAGDVLSFLGLGSTGTDVAKVGLWLVLAAGAVGLLVLGVKKGTDNSTTLENVKTKATSAIPAGGAGSSGGAGLGIGDVAEVAAA
jgi:hypothetical protein